VGDTLLLQAYDTDTGPAYTTLLTLTSGTTPSMTGLFADGADATPSISFASQTGTGFRYNATSIVVMTAGGAPIWWSGASSITMRSNGSYGFSSGTTVGTSADVFLTRDAAATLQLGTDANGSAVPQTIKAHDGVTGTDIAGASLTLAGGRGTGAGAPGTLIFQTATAVGSGTTAQTLATRLIIGATGAATLGTTAGTGAGALYAGSYFVGTTAGADCSSAAAVTTVKGIVTVCSEPVPDPLTQSEVNELRGLLMQMRGKG
jgi:hypothetical protein